jgi:hypothetical protein
VLNILVVFEIQHLVATRCQYRQSDYLHIIMALLALVFLVVSLVLIGVGVAVGLVASVLAMALVGIGVLSASFVVGIRTGRAASGIRAFLLQCGVLAGIPAGAVCAWLAQAFFAAYGTGWLVLVYGALGGAVAGVVVAFLLDFVSRRLHVWASARVTRIGAKARRAISADEFSDS